MAKIDDGSDKPEGYLTPDGELIVKNGEYVETEQGQFARWERQAPDLLALYRQKLDELERLKRQMAGGVN